MPIYKQRKLTSFVWPYTLNLLLIVFFLTINLAEAKEVIGIYEKVKINRIGLVFKAKIDTGAKNSSLNSNNINLINKNGGTWVKFDVTNKSGESATLERPLERFVNIKRKKAEAQKRPAVLLNLCLGGVLKEVEVNLVNRGNFNYKVLIGRSFLQDNFIVDVSKSYTRDPHC